MTDSKFLKQLGWSDELIEAATQIAGSIPSLESVATEALVLDFESNTVTSDHLDLSGAPVGGSEVRVRFS